jgi:hypothetical protein
MDMSKNNPKLGGIIKGEKIIDFVSEKNKDNNLYYLILPYEISDSFRNKHYPEPDIYPDTDTYGRVDLEHGDYDHKFWGQPVLIISYFRISQGYAIKLHNENSDIFASLPDIYYAFKQLKKN